MFEWVYFANVSSILDDVSVYDVRYNLGRLLAKMETEKLDKRLCCCACAGYSKPAADGFAIELGCRARKA